MSNLLLCVLLSGFLLNGHFSQAEVQPSTPESYVCFLEDLPTTWAFNPSPGTIDNSSASFSPLGFDTLNLDFRNEQPTPIEALELVVEYFDKAGDVILRVPMYAHVNPAVAHLPSNALRPSGTWGAPLNKGESELMVGEEQSIRTGHCPVKAVVTFATVRFTDGSVRTYSSPAWRLNPYIEVVPLLDKIPDPPVQPPVSLLARVRINAAGFVTGVVPSAGGDPRTVNWIRNVMGKGWKFHPAILNGEPIDSELEVLFQIHAKGMAHFVETNPVWEPVTLIRFVWTHDMSSAYDAEPDRLTLMYGVLNEGSSLPSLQPLN